MGNYSISIVPRQTTYRGNKESKAQEIVQWLIGEQAIEPTLSDCVLSGSNGGYRIREGFAKFCQIPGFLRLATNGLEVITERDVFTTIENGLGEVRCPRCQYMMTQQIFFNLIDNWWHEKGETFFCPTCGETLSLETIITIPTWGFSDLGFTFWECPQFNEEFIAEFEKRLESPVWVVYTHI